MKKKNKIENYVKLFETLNLENLHKFDKLLDENIYFEDPFNKVYGIENFKKIFSNTLNKLDNVEFKVLNIISKNNIYILKWEMIYFAFNKNNSIFGLSEEQFKYVTSRFLKTNSKNINILKKDYRDLSGQFDKIISIEMFEAVGREFWDVYFKKLKSLLNQNGIIVLQIITIKDNAFDYYKKNPDFIQKHIFPGGMLPSIRILKKILDNNKLKIIENNNYAEHYAKTLNNWRNNFNSSLNEIKNNGFDDRFIRLWNYYLAYCESGFKTKRIGLNQIKIMHN